jgi:hypothetical protein
VRNQRSSALGYLVKSNVLLDTLTAKVAEVLNRPRP